MAKAKTQTKTKAKPKAKAKAKAKAKNLTQAAYSRKKGWNRSYTGRLVKEGVIKLVKGKVNEAQANAALEAMADPARDEFKNKGRGTGAGAGEDKAKRTIATYADAKTVEQIAKAQLKQLQLKREQGKSIDSAETRRDLIQLFTHIKTRIRAIPNKTAQEIAHMKNAKRGRSLTAAIQQLMLKEIDEVLVELSQFKLPEGGKGK
jgi:hypothetical protein